MEVLKEGMHPDDRSAVFNCRDCDARLRGKMSEGKLVHDHRDGDFIQMVCPLCKHVNAVSVGRFLW